MKKIFTATAILVFALLLSACNRPLTLKDGVPDEPAKVTGSVTANQTPTPTVSSDTSVESIEAELKATSILSEDFSDIK